MNLRNRRGFTLVELLVVITIIAILIGLMMPAVNMVREASRRTQCKNNLKNIATAVQGHVAKNGERMPTGGWGAQWAGDPKRGTDRKQPGGWHYNILPYMEQQALYDSASLSMPVEVYVCPTRRRVELLPYTASSANSYVNAKPGTSIARSDYAASAGDTVDDVMSNRGPTSPSQAESLLAGNISSTSNGVIFRFSERRMAKIKSPAQTYLVGERFVNPDHYRTGRSLDDDQGWNMGYDIQVNRWGKFTPRRDTNVLPPGLSLPDTYTLFGSSHAAGFNMAFCDGSVQQLSYSIDATTHARLSNCLNTLPINAAEIR